MGFGSASSENVFTTRGLSKFVAALDGRECPTVIDLGAVVGANVPFFGELLGCRLHVVDVLLAADLWWALLSDEASVLSDEASVLDDSDVRADTGASGRLGYESESADGVLCWDVFDYQ